MSSVGPGSNHRTIQVDTNQQVTKGGDVGGKEDTSALSQVEQQDGENAGVQNGAKPRHGGSRGDMLKGFFKGMGMQIKQNNEDLKAKTKQRLEKLGNKLQAAKHKMAGALKGKNKGKVGGDGGGTEVLSRKEALPLPPGAQEALAASAERHRQEVILQKNVSPGAVKALRGVVGELKAKNKGGGDGPLYMNMEEVKDNQYTTMARQDKPEAPVVEEPVIEPDAAAVKNKENAMAEMKAVIRQRGRG